MEKTYNDFDMNDVYENEIAPLILNIKSICMNNKIPFFCTCAVTNYQKEEKNGEKTGITEYKNDGVLTGSNGIGLYQDKFEKILLVLQGVELQKIGMLRQGDADILEDIINQDSEDIIDVGPPYFLDDSDDSESNIEDIGDI